MENYTAKVILSTQSMPEPDAAAGWKAPIAALRNVDVAWTAWGRKFPITSVCEIMD